MEEVDIVELNRVSLSHTRQNDLARYVGVGKRIYSFVAHQSCLLRDYDLFVSLDYTPMNFWWVNHSQTFRQEFFGNYIWCPKRKRNGQINYFYETIREVAPGDVIFSYADGAVQGFGIAQSHCYTCPRPDEFGHVGDAWDQVGWRVDVTFNRISSPVRPAVNMLAIAPTLPERYSPINERGYGFQHAYLAKIPRSMAQVIAHLSSAELVGIIEGLQLAERPYHEMPQLTGVVEWEERECARIDRDPGLRDTEKDALIKARRGQGVFRQRVTVIERQCRVTRVGRPEHLIASHIKPWRESNNEERLSEANGLLLTPSIDHLFDRGFISFEDNGELLVSPIAHKESLQRMGVETERVVNVGTFSELQKRFLDFHRTRWFLQSLQRR